MDLDIRLIQTLYVLFEVLLSCLVPRDSNNSIYDYILLILILCQRLF